MGESCTNTYNNYKIVINFQRLIQIHGATNIANCKKQHGVEVASFYKNIAKRYRNFSFLISHFSFSSA